MNEINFQEWEKAKAGQFKLKKEFIEQLLEEREKLHLKQLEELLQEECKLGTRLLQIQDRNFSLPQDTSIANAVYSALSRIAEQRRHMESNFWKEKTQLKQMLQEIKLEEKSTLYLPQWK